MALKNLFQPVVIKGPRGAHCTRDRIVPSLAVWMTSSKSFDCEEETGPNSMPLYGLECIIRAGGVKSTLLADPGR